MITLVKFIIVVFASLLGGLKASPEPITIADFCFLEADAVAEIFTLVNLDKIHKN
jgi:hypothetical protein